MRERNGASWILSVVITAVVVLFSLWLWFGTWEWEGIPWLVAGGLPFVIGVVVPRLPLLFGLLPLLVPVLIEGGVGAPALLAGIGLSLIATGVGLLLRRLIGGRDL